MPEKPKARGSAGKKSKAQKDKAQSERFIEVARKLAVDESGRDFGRVVDALIRKKPSRSKASR